MFIITLAGEKKNNLQKLTLVHMSHFIFYFLNYFFESCENLQYSNFTTVYLSTLVYSYK